MRSDPGAGDEPRVERQRRRALAQRRGLCGQQRLGRQRAPGRAGQAGDLGHVRTDGHRQRGPPTARDRRAVVAHERATRGAIVRQEVAPGAEPEHG